MESYLHFAPYDLASPDGKITRIARLSPDQCEVEVSIEAISPAFKGFSIDTKHILFNLKSTLAQLGVNSIDTEFLLEPKYHRARIKCKLVALGSVAKEVLPLLTPGAYIGKLFAADPRRRVREPDYLLRMVGRSDRQGGPLLSLGEDVDEETLPLEVIDGRTVAFLKLQNGVLAYEKTIRGALHLLTQALHYPEISTRALLKLEQRWMSDEKKNVQPGELLLVRTSPLHVRTVFGHVVNSLLPKGVQHTSATILDPTTAASGDIYELFGNSKEELTTIPLEFYTLEPHREYVFFSDRDQLQTCLEDPVCLFQAFQTAPSTPALHCAVFVVKGEQLMHLKESDWIARKPVKTEFPGLIHPKEQSHLVERYIEQQPSYPFLKSIQNDEITSEGVLLTRYFPSPLLKKMLISDLVQKKLKGIYFEYPSYSSGDYFSHEDRSMLLDLAKFAIPVFWVDKSSGKILEYVPKPEKDCGMFVPLSLVSTFMKAVTFGVYGSHIIPGANFEKELTSLFQNLLRMREELNHPHFNKTTPLALVTGGGPGVMELGNRVAQSLNILSCANIVDFRAKPDSVIPTEQKPNPYIEAKMTYRLDRLVERQAEFNLDFPIFLMGGIGTDFEYELEQVRRKVGSTPALPILLFGEEEYWRKKITSCFQCNLDAGTIAGSEWVSNCFFSVQSAQQGLNIYRQFFSGTLPIGRNGPVFKEGFVSS